MRQQVSQLKEREKELILKLSRDNVVLTYENRIKDMKAEIDRLREELQEKSMPTQITQQQKVSSDYISQFQ